MSVSDIGEAVPYGEAIALVHELLAEQGSHFHAAFNGWKYPMSQEAMWAASLTVSVKNMLLAEGQKPVTFPWPWPDPEEEASRVTEEERQALRAQLKAHSAFGQVRNKE